MIGLCLFCDNPGRKFLKKYLLYLGFTSLFLGKGISSFMTARLKSSGRISVCCFSAYFLLIASSFFSSSTISLFTASTGVAAGVAFFGSS
jgi:hypothetical protein